MDPTDLGDGGLAPALPLGLLGRGGGAEPGLRPVPGSSGTRLAVTCPGDRALLLLYGPASVPGAAPRIAVSWRHLGVADAMANGVFDPRIDVYFNWPGFFPGLATFIEASGLPPLQVAAWAPVANVALWSLGGRCCAPGVHPGQGRHLHPAGGCS